MKTVAIFVLCFLAMTQATRTVSGVVNFMGFPLNLSQKRSIMTLLTQVEALMKNGGPLDQITKMLNEFKDAIVNEQVAHDNLYEKQVAECAGEKDFRVKEISDATASLKAAQEVFDGCTAQLARAKADLSIAKNQLSDNLQYQVIVEETEKSAKDLYNVNVEQTKGLITAIEEGLVILEEFFQGEASFMQLTQHANKMLKLSVHVKRAAHMAPILGAFVQLANKQEEFDEIVAKRVRQLLNDLRDQFTSFLEKLVEDGDARVAKYNEEIGRVKAVISSLETDINDLTFEISQLDKCIVNNTGIISSAQAKIDRNQRLLDDADNLCAAVVVEYEQATKARKGELKLLSALRERVEARFGQISQGVTARGTLDKEQFEYAHENDYEHKTFTPSQ